MQRSDDPGRGAAPDVPGRGAAPDDPGRGAAPDDPGRGAAPQDDAGAAAAAAGYAAGRLAARRPWLLLALGALSLGAGLLAILMPLLGTLVAVLCLGAVLLLSGLFGAIGAFDRRGGWQVAGAFAFALLSVAAGVLVLLQPVLGVFALTTLFIAWLIVGGAVRLYAGIARRGRRGASWTILSGLAALGLGLLLWAGLPDNAAWVPGLVFGLDLVFWGLLVIALAGAVDGPDRDADRETKGSTR